MADIDLGSALTGEDPNSAAAKWDDFMQRPGNRQALLQIGLQMMQPVGIGQTTGGHIAQAIGSGGEAVDRGIAQEQKELALDNKLAESDAYLDIAQQNANTARQRASQVGRTTGGLTETFRERARRQDEWRETQRVDKDAARIQSRLDKLRSDKLLNPNLATPPDLAPFEGKDIDQIRNDLKKKRRGLSAVPGETADDTEVDDSDTPAAMPATPPEPGAKQGRRADGSIGWYVPDPQRPGKFLEVR